MAEDSVVEEESGRAALGSALRYLRQKAGKSLGELAEPSWWRNRS